MPDEALAGQAPGAGLHRSLELCVIEVILKGWGPVW